jgi:hypothetical protein
MKLLTILFALLLLASAGCMPNASPGTWVPLEESTRGFRSPSFYTNTAIRLLKAKYPGFDSSAYRLDGPYRPEPEDKHTRYPRWIQMHFHRCYTPDRLRAKQNPVTLEDFEITLNSRGKEVFIQTWSNSVDVTDWNLQQYLYLGTKLKPPLGEKP